MRLTKLQDGLILLNNPVGCHALNSKIVTVNGESRINKLQAVVLLNKTIHHLDYFAPLICAKRGQRKDESGAKVKNQGFIFVLALKIKFTVIHPINSGLFYGMFKTLCF